MALTLAQALTELQGFYHEGFPWETEVQNLTAFGFTQNEATLKAAIAKVLQQIKSTPAGTAIPNLSHFAFGDGGNSIVAVAET